MSRQQPPPFVRKTSAPWDRLRPVKQDPLEVMGYVSKGDTRLLDPKAQEAFFQKIVDRYLDFCTQHKHSLDRAFAALSLQTENPHPSESTKSLPVGKNSPQHNNTNTTAVSPGLAASKWAAPDVAASTTLPPLPPPPPPPSDPGTEIHTILMALRKLREGVLATSQVVSAPRFSQQVHIFNIRVAILTLHPQSYHPSILYLLTILHSKQYPLANAELKEMTTYMILDLALRQKDMIAAYTLRHNSRKNFGYVDPTVDSILRAVVARNWVAFWRILDKVDGYTRALMHWHVETLRKTTLKAFGRAYLKTDLKWLMKNLGGDESNWEEIKQKENIGWLVDGNHVIIRKPKAKA